MIISTYSIPCVSIQVESAISTMDNGGFHGQDVSDGTGQGEGSMGRGISDGLGQGEDSVGESVSDGIGQGEGSMGRGISDGMVQGKSSMGRVVMDGMGQGDGFLGRGVSDRVGSGEGFMGTIVSDGKGHEKTGKRGRRRVRNPELWKRNITKRRRNSGKSYEGRGGKQQRSRKIKKGCGDGCKYKCHQNVSEEMREEIFYLFWGCEDVNF